MHGCRIDITLFPLGSNPGRLVPWILKQTQKRHWESCIVKDIGNGQELHVRGSKALGNIVAVYGNSDGHLPAISQRDYLAAFSGEYVRAATVGKWLCDMLLHDCTNEKTQGLIRSLIMLSLYDDRALAFALKAAYYKLAGSDGNK